MTTAVQKLADKVKALPEGQLHEFLDWLTEYELSQLDEWDRQIERDTTPGGSLDKLIQSADADISAGRTKSLDSVIDDT